MNKYLKFRNYISLAYIYVLLTNGHNSTLDDVVIEQRRKSTHNKMLSHNIGKLRKIITVEPLVGLYQLAIILSKPVLENLEFEKACRVNLGYNDTICDAVLRGNHTNFSTENGNIQIVIGKMQSWQQPIQSFVPLLLILFLGSYSDRHKWRKPLFTIPILGDLIGNLGCILCVWNMTSWPIELLGVFQKVVPSFFGSQALITMATTAYVADISSVESRTFRIGMMTIVISMTGFLGNLLSGLLFMRIGYQNILILSLLMYVTALIFGLFWIKECQTHKEGNVGLLADLFNPKHALDSFRVLKNNTPNSSQLYAMLLMLTLHRAAIDGDNSLLYRYVQNVFQWTITDYTNYLSVNYVVSLVGNILGLYLFVKILGIGDLIILFVTIVSKILSNLLYGCARTSLVFYIGNIAAIAAKLYRIAKRSYATKIVSPEDIGKTQSLINIVESLSPVLSVPLYNLIYIHTLQTFPAATIFLSIFIYVICCCIIAWMFCKIGKNKKIEKETFESHPKYTKTDNESSTYL